ncbi:MAG: TetR/AcrR family transcriptional regulator [Acidimicrobiia bacterium]|nr:TetR/AcrR family transcriptional regulator [Acidimicrobiia bacterium]
MRLPAEQRRRQLLDVARDVFGQRGFHATSMDDVADAAGVTKPVLYQHFPSKRALYLELLEDVGGELLRAVRSGTGRAETGRGRVELGFAAYFRYVMGNRTSFRLLFGASVRNDPEFAEVADRWLRQVVDEITTLIEIDASSEHRRVLAHAIVGMAESTSRRALNDPTAEEDPDRLAAWLAEMTWFGLRGVRSDDEPDPVGAVTPLRPGDPGQPG